VFDAESDGREEPVLGAGAGGGYRDGVLLPVEHPDGGVVGGVDAISAIASRTVSRVAAATTPGRSSASLRRGTPGRRGAGAVGFPS
jgi:hypothetical protein